METHHDRIGLLDFGRAALGLLPSAISSLWATLKVYALTPDSHQSIGSILEHQAENVPDKDCLLFEGQRWSYRDVNAWANRIAHVLKTHGVGPGDTVGLLFENCPELLACVAAVAKLGAVAGMLNPKQRGAVLSHSMRTIQPRLMVIGDGCLPALHSASPPQPDSVPRLWAGMGPVPRGRVDLPAKPGLPCYTTTNWMCTVSLLAAAVSFLACPRWWVRAFMSAIPVNPSNAAATRTRSYCSASTNPRANLRAL